MSKKEKKRRRFRPIRFIFKLVGVLILIMILIPVVLLLLMFDWGNYQPPVNDFEAVGGFMFQEFVAERLNTFIEDDDAMYIDVSITTPQINQAIFNVLRTMNENYLVEGVEGSQYFLQEGPIGFRGVTVSITDDVIRIDAGLNASLTSWLNYRMRLRVDLKVVESPNGFDLQIQRLNISHLRISSLYGMARTVLNWFDIDIAAELESLVPFGEFNGEDLSWHLSYTEIFNMLGDGDDAGMFELLAMLVTAELGADHERLFRLGLFADNNPDIRGRASILFNLGLFRTNRPSHELLHSIQTEDELDQLFRGQISNMLISSIMHDSDEEDDYLRLDLSTEILNEIIAFRTGGQMISDIILELGGTNFIFGTEPIFLQPRANGRVDIGMFMNLTNEETGASFRSLFMLGATVGASDDRRGLVFTIEHLQIGEIGLDAKLIDTLLGLFDSDMITGRTLVLEGFVDDIAQQGVEVRGITAREGFLEIIINPGDDEQRDIINQVREHINSALEDLIEDDRLSDSEFDDVNAAIRKMLDSDTRDTEEVMAEINRLAPEQQELFFDVLTDILEDKGVDNLNNLIPMEE